MNPHPYRLRPYHNPENVPWSKIPPGWRLLYADELGRVQTPKIRCWGRFGRISNQFSDFGGYIGNVPQFTYIVPVAA